MGTRIVMVFWKTAPILALLGVTAASSVAGQEVDVTVVLYWGVEGEAPKRPFRRVEVVAQTFDIAAETLTVRALFRSRTVAERAAGGSGVLACRYRNRRAISEGSGGTLYWLDCDRERPEPQSFERLQHANVTIREGGRTYSTVCGGRAKRCVKGETAYLSIGDITHTSRGGDPGKGTPSHEGSYAGKQVEVQ